LIPDPAKASFFPFADYSPEYQAALWAGFIDLPASDRLYTAADEAEEDRAVGDGGDIARDPIGALASAASYDDGESWWSDVIEEWISIGRRELSWCPRRVRHALPGKYSQP
jgi:hypothetical protein